MPNFSNNYNKETQKKCIDCGIVYDLAPVAVSTFKPEEYKNWETDINSKERKR